MITDLVGYTGRAGSHEQAVTITRSQSDNSRDLPHRPRALQRRRGHEVAVAFQKGILAEPTGTHGARLLALRSPRPGAAAARGAARAALQSLRLGRASAATRTRAPSSRCFHAPKDFSPALVHYIHRMGWKQTGWTAFTASIFDLGVKGLVTIDNAGKTLTDHGHRQAAPTRRCRPAKAVLFDYFTRRGQRHHRHRPTAPRSTTSAAS